MQPLRASRCTENRTSAGRPMVKDEQDDEPLEAEAVKDATDATDTATADTDEAAAAPSPAVPAATTDRVISQLGPIAFDRRHALLGGAILGAIMGLLTTFLPIPAFGTFLLWSAAYVYLIADVHKQQVPHPFGTLFMLSTFGGVVVGLIQGLLHTVYADVYDLDLEGSWVANFASFLGFAIVAGLVFGVIIGLIARFLDGRRA